MCAAPAPTPGLELLTPTPGDLTLKYVWTVPEYARTVKKRDTLDSPGFEHRANGVRTRWNLSVRFWRGPDGRRLFDPAVVCLNLVACDASPTQQAGVRFRFGVFDRTARAWELCRPSRVVLNLETTSRLLSVGHTDVCVHPRHGRDVSLCVRLQISPTDDGEECHTLSHDLSRVLGTGDVTLRCEGGREIRAHSVILSARSEIFASLLDRSGELDLSESRAEVISEVLRYVYTDRTERVDAMAVELLAEADRFGLVGLKAACERSLADAATPENLASLLSLVERYDCAALGRSLLARCGQDSPEMGGSTSSDLESLASDSGVAGL